jgi:hypothetical protein
MRGPGDRGASTTDDIIGDIAGAANRMTGVARHIGGVARGRLPGSGPVVPAGP